MHTGVLQAIIARMAKRKVRGHGVYTGLYAGVCRDRSPAGCVVSFIGFAPIFVKTPGPMGYDVLVGRPSGAS